VKNLKLEHYAQQYGELKLTLASAATKAGLSVWEFQEYTRLRRIPTQYDHADLEHDLRTIKER
jgi:predicted HTH domain antitoxin